jgi:hypothetical protein
MAAREFEGEIAAELAAAFPAWLRPAAMRAGRPAAARLARLLMEMDRMIASDPSAASNLLIRALGAEPPPAASLPDGPILIESNHPGLIDAMLIWSAVRRDDMLTLASERTLMLRLPQTRARLIEIAPHGGRAAIQAAIRHWERGGAILCFPAGRIEPDPARRPLDAEASRRRWSSCLRRAAERRGIPAVEAMVSGVICPSALNSAWARLRQEPERREWTAATLQLLQLRRPVPLAAELEWRSRQPPRTMMQTSMRQEFMAIGSARASCPGSSGPA